MSLRLGNTVLAGFSANARRVVKHIPSCEESNQIVLDQKCSSKSYIDLYINKVAQDPDYFSLSADGYIITLSETLSAGNELVVKYWETLPTAGLATDEEFLNGSDLKSPSCKQIQDNIVRLISPDFNNYEEVKGEWTTDKKLYVMPFDGYIQAYFNSSDNSLTFAAGNEDMIIGVCGHVGGPIFLSPVLPAETTIYYWSEMNTTAESSFKVLRVKSN